MNSVRLGVCAFAILSSACSALKDDGHSVGESQPASDSDGGSQPASGSEGEHTGAPASASEADPDAAPVPWVAETEAWRPKDPSAPPSDTPVAAHGWLSVQGVDLVNETGSPVQLRGVSSTWLNWDLNGYATDLEGMKFMRDNWNLSVFRAAIPVDVDGGYLNNTTATLVQVRRIVQNAIDLGVYVIVDWHTHSAHLNFDESSEFFDTFTREFGEYPNVLYEPFNEPLPNEVDWDVELKLYYQAIIPVIRQHSPKSVVILGTPELSSLVYEAARDPAMGSNLMYSLHFYACDHAQALRQEADAALNLGAPIFVTEWAATTRDGGVADKRVCADEALLWHEWMNANNISWTAWKLDACTDASCLLGDLSPSSGGWSDTDLQGHGSFVVQRLLAP